MSTLNTNGVFIRKSIKSQITETNKFIIFYCNKFSNEIQIWLHLVESRDQDISIHCTCITYRIAVDRQFSNWLCWAHVVSGSVVQLLFIFLLLFTYCLNLFHLLECVTANSCLSFISFFHSLNAFNPDIYYFLKICYCQPAQLKM